MLCFNPLPSCEGRLDRAKEMLKNECFNPLPSCEGRLTADFISGWLNVLQSTSLLRGKTRWKKNFRRTQNKLQSTSLLRGKTRSISKETEILIASIHFPLAREDGSPGQLRQWALSLQSTSLLRGKTNSISTAGLSRTLQSTSLLRGKTASELLERLPDECFNPLPSCEGRPPSLCCSGTTKCFNPLPSCEGRL